MDKPKEDPEKHLPEDPGKDTTGEKLEAAAAPSAKPENQGEKKTSTDNVQVVSKDGGELTFKNDQLVAAKRADGTRLTFRWEDKKLTRLTINEQYSYTLDGDHWTYSAPNGTEKFKGSVEADADGTCTYQRNNNIKEVVTLSGAHSLNHACGTVCKLDKQGNLEKLKRASGDTLECHWEGGKLTRLTECRGASKTTWVKEANLDKWTSLDSIGATRYDLKVTREGELSFEASNGSRYHTHADGSRTWNLRDGSTLEMRPDYGATKVKLDGITLEGSYTKDKLTGIREDCNGQVSNWILKDNVWTSAERPGIERRNLKMDGTYSYIESDSAGVRQIRYPDGSLRDFERLNGEIIKVTEKNKGETVVWTNESGNLWSSVQNKGGQLVKLTEERSRVKTQGTDYRYTTNDGLSHTYHIDGSESVEPKQLFKYGTRTYDEGMPLFQLANREIKEQKQKQNFIHDLEAFARRADVQGLSDNTVADAFKAVNELVKSKDGLDDNMRWRLAREIMHHLAQPRRIDQGYHDTCNVSIIEVITAAQRPDRFASIIKEAALAGAVTTSGGHKIAIDSDSRKPDFEAKSFDPYEPYFDGSRSFASQLFQVAAVNTHYALKNPNYVYQQRAPEKALDTGERLVDKAGNIKARQPDLINDQLIELAKELSGIKLTILESPGAGGTLTQKVASGANLLEKLAQLKSTAQMPVGVMVHTGSEPYWTNSGAGRHGGTGGWHVETIWDVDISGKILVDNQWGSRSDHEGARRLTSDQLFAAMTKVR